MERGNDGRDCRPAMTRYAEARGYPIDRLPRSAVVGWRNYLFLGSDDGADAAPPSRPNSPGGHVAVQRTVTDGLLVRRLPHLHSILLLVAAEVLDQLVLEILGFARRDGGGELDGLIVVILRVLPASVKNMSRGAERGA